MLDDSYRFRIEAAELDMHRRAAEVTDMKLTEYVRDALRSRTAVVLAADDPADDADDE